jgi:hypothetical protein
MGRTIMIVLLEILEDLKQAMLHEAVAVKRGGEWWQEMK